MILPGTMLQNVGHSHPLHKSWAVRCSLHMLYFRMDGQYLGVPLRPVLPMPGLESYTPVTLRFSWLPPSCLQVPAEVAWPAPRPRLCSPLACGLLTQPPRMAWGKCATSWLVCLPIWPQSSLPAASAVLRSSITLQGAWCELDASAVRTEVTAE